MLKAAQLYADRLEDCFYRIWYDEKYKFYVSGAYNYMEPLDEDTTEHHQFVSCSNYQVIGYISYAVDRSAGVVSDLNIINFSDNMLTFGKDVAQAIDDIFVKFGFNKLEFAVVEGNPAEHMYDRFIELTGGRIVGTYISHTRLIDGKLYNLKMYELLRMHYMQHREKFIGIKEEEECVS